MNRRTRASAVKSLFALLLLLALCACALPFPRETEPAPPAAFDTAEELLAILEASEDRSFSRVSGWLSYWGFPAYARGTLDQAEDAYRSYYVGELPDTETAARRLAGYFAEYMEAVDLTDRGAVTDLVMDCYLAAVGDKYAYYMNAETYADYTSDMTGDFVGIGVRVVYSALDRTMEIVSVMRDTPAMAAGLASGDIIRAVDGVSVDELSYYEILDRIKGAVGSSVTVTVLRGDALLSFTMHRERLVQTTVEGKMLGDGIGYLRITEFDGTTFSQFQDTLSELKSEGADAIVFDVRDNPGGALDAILSVLDYMVPDRDASGKRVPLASYGYYDGYRETDYARDGLAEALGLSIAVLANEYTASAGELFTSALSDYAERGLLDATVVGKKTYGKGTMQSVLELSGGGAMAISIAYYDPPYSGNYEGKGVEPDIPSELSPEAAQKSVYQLTPDEDTQLADALTALGRGR